MQAQMNFSQMNSVNNQVRMIQLQQNKLAATSLLLTNIQMNHLLSNEEAECGINPNSEDLDLEEDDGATPNRLSVADANFM